jgi:hypothetical protein
MRWKSTYLDSDRRGDRTIEMFLGDSLNKRQLGSVRSTRPRPLEALSIA